MERITSRKNPLLEHMRRLDSAAFRRQQGEFLCDSPKLVEEALRHGARVLAVAVSDGVKPPEGLDASVRCAAVPPDVMASISPMRTPQGMLAVCRLPDTALPEMLPGSRYVVLDGVQDPGNVGTVLRTADAFGCDGVLLLTGCADPYSVKTLRSSMGAVFRMPVWCTDAAAMRQRLTAAGLPLYGAALRDDTEDVRALDLRRCAIAIGSEGRGGAGAGHVRQNGTYPHAGALRVTERGHGGGGAAVGGLSLKKGDEGDGGAEILAVADHGAGAEQSGEAAAVGAFFLA